MTLCRFYPKREGIQVTNKIIEMSGIHKSFPNVKAIDGGHFDLYAGEIHSLIGENGAGKSTLMKTLYGMYTPDAGTIRIKGEDIGFYTPHDAIARGIGMVHQEFMLVKEFTVLENIILGFEPRKSCGRIDFKAARERVDYFTKTYHLSIQPQKKAKDISVGEAQRVEIIKTLYRGADVLILDEPTAVLTPQESLKLFDILESLRADGKSIVFISHKLREVMAISDRISVMRQGKYIATVNKADTTIPELAKLMVGREVFLNTQRASGEVGETVLWADQLFVPGERELSKLRGLSLEIKRGETLGIAGIDGNGQSELLEALTGLRPVEKGKVIFLGQEIQNLTPFEIRQRGVAHIPEDRNVRGLNRTFSVEDNLIGVGFREEPFSDGFRMNKSSIREYARALIKKFDIRPSEPQISARNFSGGNAQKIVIAREIERNAALLIAAQPTRGVDIGSIETIRNILNEVKKTGTAVLLVSADLDEVLSLSDRIAVMYEGKITGIVAASDATEENIGLLMTGGSLPASKTNTNEGGINV